MAREGVEEAAPVDVDVAAAVEIRHRLREQARRGLDDRGAAAHRCAHQVRVRRRVPEAGAVAVAGGEQREETGELEHRGALAALAGAELQREAVVEEQHERELALLDVLLAVRFAATRGDVPVDVTDVVTELVLHDLVELAAASAESGAILAAEQRVRGVADAPLELAKDGHGMGSRRIHVGEIKRNTRASAEREGAWAAAEEVAVDTNQAANLCGAFRPRSFTRKKGAPAGRGGRGAVDHRGRTRRAWWEGGEARVEGGRAWVRSWGRLSLESVWWPGRDGAPHRA